MGTKRVKLTDLMVQRLGPGMYWDELPAFGLRVGVQARTFIVAKDHRKITIGRYPLISLLEARLAAKRILIGDVEKSRPVTFQAAVERFLEVKSRELRPRSHSEYKRLLKFFSFPDTEPSQRDVMEALDRIKFRSERTHAYTALKVFFNWAMQYEYCKYNPLSRIKKPPVGSSRERVLLDAELKAIWAACNNFGQFGVIVQLLICTGQRRSQIGGLRKEWIDEENSVIKFPASIMKNKLPHDLPFGNVADLLMRQFYTFGGTFNGWGACKTRLDRKLDIDHWTLHDLRRTWASMAASEGVPPHVISRVLSHSAPEGTVASIYNRYKYEKEMREAVERVEDRIMKLCVL